MGRSIAAVTPDDRGGFSFEKQAPTVSYGAHADALVTTLRRSPSTEGNDQVVVLTRASDTVLEPKGTWDPLGMRGTCSPGFVVRATLSADQILAAPFSSVMTQTMVPVSHLLWAHLWLGIATDAFDRARAFVRAAARQKPGEPVPAAVRLSHVLRDLSLLRAEVHDALEKFLATDAEDREKLGTMMMALRFNNLKLAASEQAPRICSAVLELIGIAAYKNDSPFAVGRHLRDALSGRLMVANERIHSVDARLLLIAKEV
jgi:acyl-CoA dehydrogenase